MSGTLPEPLPESYYLGWVAAENNWADGIRTAKALATRLRKPLTFVVPSKNHLDESLKREHVITTRTSFPPHGSFVAALYPDLRDMARVFSESKHFLVVEHATNDMSGWAATQGAFDLRAGAYVEDDRPARVREVHEQIDYIGYNGFRSPPGSYSIGALLRELHELGWLDERGKSFLLGTLVATRSDISLGDLRRLADKISPRPNKV